MVKVEKKFTFSGHRDCVYALEKEKEGHKFFSGSGDGMVVAWNLNQPDQGDLLAKVPHSIYALKYIPEEDLLIVGQNFEGLHFIRVGEKKEIASLKCTQASIFDLQVLGDQIIMAESDGHITLVDRKQLIVKNRIKLSEKSARTIALSPDGEQFAVGYSDHKIRIFNSVDQSLVKTIASHTNSIFTLQYSPSGTHLLSAGRDAHLKVWEVEKDYQLQEDIIAHMYAINHICFDPSGKYFATASMDKSIKIWRYEDFRLLKVVDKSRHAGHATSVNKLAWLPEKNFLISGSDDRNISIWNITFE
ncbi:WD40 repeat domain-containing protein [Persicobacter diffluens]|uniref:Translation initiation factor beta propellor-like domain-containing protein n=1 Tax=Persicobacter diffluens TaxID=981 RepID=A0AAN5AIQ4_9BACT|nr:hypothetical protein PEDI_06390 [Persicobacter diffluens]